MSDDDDKTVFGQPLPPVPQRPSGGTRNPPPPNAGEQTIFGQPLPPPGQGWGAQVPPPDQSDPWGVAPAPPASPQQYPPANPPHPQSGAWNNPGADDTWLGGALNPQPGYPPQSAPPAYPPQPTYPPQPAPQPQSGWQQPAPQPGSGQAPAYRTETGRPAGAEFFPDIPRNEAAPQQSVQPRIAFEQAIKSTGIGAGGSSNPLVAAAASLLLLLGRLRTGLVEMQAAPLIDHVAQEIDAFERNALAAGVSAHDVTDAKYALAATADDIVQNLPGADRGTWLEYSMIARFFGERSSGVGFFKKVDEAMRAPAQRFNLLELVLTCLSLGFEGQYRALPNGAVELARIRNAIYETLRRVQQRPDDDIAVRWAAVPMDARKRRGVVPLWAVTAVAVAMIVSLFATLSTLLSRQSTETGDMIIALHRGLPAVAIERQEPVVEPYVAPESTQLERLRAALATEIAAERVEVDRNNDWVFIRVSNYLQFGPASATLESDFSELAAEIGAALDAEHGPIRVVGHTDSDPLSGRGFFKTNEQLSEARAQTVADLLQSQLADADRLRVEGVGATEPIADNTTADGKARNRRVEILVQREN
ncbi:MAG: type IVB secretion system protein IcmH/DotU [Loktanella sp.]|nr:type IVB secretion system protein IcmH/DotU [Loktanella sp.]